MDYSGSLGMKLVGFDQALPSRFFDKRDLRETADLSADI